MNTPPNPQRRLLSAVERLGWALRAQRQEVATRLGVSLLGLSLLEVLADERPRRVGRLAAEMAVSPPTVSDAVATLEAKGVLRRVADPDDGRASLVELTERGRQYADQVRADGVTTGPSATPAHDYGVALRVLLEELRRLHAAGVIRVNRSCPLCMHYASEGDGGRARCLLLDTTLADHDLRVDCPEHAPAAAG